MNIIFYVIIFIIGAFLGNLYATIIRRMSKEKKLASVHSYCTKCGEKLSILEQIPILSYIFLRGKCKYCKKPIGRKYIYLECINGSLLLITAYILKISIYNINSINLTSFIFLILYFAYIIITVGMDIEKRKMPSILLSYGIVISIIYLIHLFIVESTTIYSSIIYLVIMILLLLANILNAKKRAQSSYLIDLLTMLLIMLIFTNELICILTIAGTLLTIALYILIKRFIVLRNKIKRDNRICNTNMKIVSIMGALNILLLLIILIINK